MTGGLLSRWRTLLGHHFCDFSGPLHGSDLLPGQTERHHPVSSRGFVCCPHGAVSFRVCGDSFFE